MHYPACERPNLFNARITAVVGRFGSTCRSGMCSTPDQLRYGL